MTMLAAGADRAQVWAALMVAGTIGGYTLADSHAAREYETFKYVFVTQIVSGVTISDRCPGDGPASRPDGVHTGRMASHGGGGGDDDRRLRARAARGATRSRRLRRCTCGNRVC